MLEARGIVVPDESRTRVTECQDIEQLDRWLRLATTADSADHLFD